MNDSILLFKLTEADIKVTIEAYFEGEALIIDGYDIGKRVDAYWGDSDYEYQVKILPDGVAFFYQYLQVEPGNKRALLEALAQRFNTNSCYSEIRSLIEENKLPSEGFSWT
jgi:hypothetical protein